jgi:hypothetical protein
VIHVFRTVIALIIIANCLGLAQLLTAGPALRQIYPMYQPWMSPALAILALASIFACIALWRLRRWGLGLLVVAYSLMLMINLGFHAPLAHTMLGPIGLVLLGAAYWPIRERFSDFRDTRTHSN